MKNACSYNNRLIVEKYIKEALRSDTSQNKAFAMIAQKTHLKGLKVLVNATINDGTMSGQVVRAGSTVYIKEEVLHTAPWASKAWECAGIEGQFIIVDLSHVEIIEHV